MSPLVQIAGAVMVLVGFFLAQRDFGETSRLRYLLLNLVGATILAVEAALAAQWVFVLLETAWALVSARSLLHHRSASAAGFPQQRSRDLAV